jgi:hypothetical protein
VGEPTAPSGAAPTRWRRAEGTLWRRLLDGVLLLPPAAARPLEMSGPGAVVWAELARPATVEDLVDRVRERYDVEPSVARRDLERLVADLASAGAVERLDPGA